MKIVAESGHWYTTAGEPAYQIEGKTGLRNTTLRDAKKLNLLPSVTTVLNCAAKPGLDIWKQQQVLLAALTLPRGEGESDESYCDRVMTDSKAQGKEAMNRGTHMHGILESFFEGVLLESVPTYCRSAENALTAHFGAKKWISEKAFANVKFGYGGKVDLYSRSDDLINFPGAVIDFKTTEKDLDDVAPFFEHFMQLAAYREGLGMPDASCAVIYVNNEEARLFEISQENLTMAWECFCHLLHFYRIKSKL